MRLNWGKYLCLIALWAMILPFAASSLIAKGVMPTVSPGGVVMLTICTGDGMIEMAFDAATMEPVSGGGKGDQPAPDSGACAWAAAHPVFVIPDLAVADMRAGQVIDQIAIFANSALRVAAATGLPPATGPPFRI